METNNLYYKRINSKNPKGTLIFLHGLTGNNKRWKDYISTFKKNYNLILFDLISHGKSSFPNKLENYSSFSQAESILEILKKEGIQKSSIICHSYSSNIALELILQSSFDFDSLIMISPFFLERKFLKNKKIIYLKTVMPFWKFLQHKKKVDLFNYPKEANKISFLDYKKGIEEIGIKSYLAHLHSCSMACQINEMEKIKIPTLLIYKENDNACGKQTIKLLKEKIPNIEKKEISGSGHLFLVENQKEISNAIIVFLRKRSRIIVHSKPNYTKD